MSTYLPDTNILIDALNHKRGRHQLLRALVVQGHALACCDITVAEIYSGMLPQEAARTDAFLEALVWVRASRNIARRAGRLRFDYARQGITLTLPDVLIAATALEENLTVITANEKHFPIPELSLYPLRKGDA